MSGYYEARKDDFLISTDPSLLEIDIIHSYLSGQSYWANGIPREIVERSITHSLCFGVYRQGQQVGFARVVTDKATFAWLADVFIMESDRGKGLSKWLMTIIQSHPDLQGFRRWMLGTRDAHGLYKQFGWTELDEETKRRLMQRHFKDIYRKK